MVELSIERECELAYKLWTGICSAVVFSCLRSHGQEVIAELERRSIARHQSAHFRQGITKLGLDGEANDVIRCAKYHYFSNTLGALPMHYVEESPVKVWIRYLAPYWMGDSPLHPGAGPAVLGAAFGRAPYLGWHANNGRYLGNDRLVFVQTQSVPDGDPWDAGYFTLHDEAVAPGQGYFRRIGEWGPRFDAADAPTLPHADWPAERRARALRSYIIDFTASRCATLVEMIGEADAARVIGHGLRIMLLQRTHSLAEEVGLARVQTAGEAAAFVARVAAVSGDEVHVEQAGHRAWLHVSAHRFWRSIEQHSPALDAALVGAWSATLALHAPGLSCRLEAGAEAHRKTWCFEEDAVDSAVDHAVA